MKKNAIWLGPFIAFLGCVTYFFIFSQFPITRDYPWVNLPVVGLGVLLSLVALLGWKHSGLFKKMLLGAGAGFSVFFAGFLFLYVFVISSQMPIPKLPGFTSNPNAIALPATGGRTLSMGDYPGKRILVSFFRGYW